jgi:hypothetical protein
MGVCPQRQLLEAREVVLVEDPSGVQKTQYEPWGNGLPECGLGIRRSTTRTPPGRHSSSL